MRKKYRKRDRERQRGGEGGGEGERTDGRERENHRMLGEPKQKFGTRYFCR